MNRDVCEHFAPADLHCEKCDAIGDTVVVPDTVRDAAPDLLEALERLVAEFRALMSDYRDIRIDEGSDVQSLEEELDDCIDYVVARAAIAKAKGET